MVRSTNEFIFPSREMDQKMRDLLKELYDLKPELHDVLWFEWFVNQYKAWRESSSTSFDSYLKGVVSMIRRLKFASFKD